MSLHSGSRSSAGSTSASTAAPTPLASFKRDLRARETLQRRSNAVQFTHTRLELDLRALEQDIKEDRAAQREYEKQLSKMAARKLELRKIIQQQQEFTQQFDKQIGPFEERYNSLQHSVDGLHSEAKGKYQAALQLLVDQLGYHPAFKRHDDII